MRTIQNQTFDEERALYGNSDILVKDCSFDGPADGESAFKECKDVQVAHSFFNLRYPFWHDQGVTIRDSEMTELCRAALWYSDDICMYRKGFIEYLKLEDMGSFTAYGKQNKSPEKLNELKEFGRSL